MAPLSIQIYVVGPVQTNCYFAINDDTKEVLIIDPGASAKQLAEKVKRLADRVDTLESQVSYLREKNRDQRERIEELEEKETNFEYLKDYLGKSEVEGIVEYARSKEQADREKERYYGRGR